MQITRMRLPTNEEWDRLVEITHGDDSLMHWKSVFSWCRDGSENFSSMPTSAKAVRGWVSARKWVYFHRSTRSSLIGFRSAFEFSGAIGLADGDYTVVGNLLMNDKPIQVPGNPTKGGDIPSYIPGATLELGHMLDSPIYKVWAIKAGAVLIADRVLLGNISWMEANVNFQPEQVENAPNEKTL